MALANDKGKALEQKLGASNASVAYLDSEYWLRPVVNVPRFRFSTRTRR